VTDETCVHMILLIHTIFWSISQNRSGPRGRLKLGSAPDRKLISSDSTRGSYPHWRHNGSNSWRLKENSNFSKKAFKLKNGKCKRVAYGTRNKHCTVWTQRKSLWNLFVANAFMSSHEHSIIEISRNFVYCFRCNGSHHCHFKNASMRLRSGNSHGNSNTLKYHLR